MNPPTAAVKCRLCEQYFDEEIIKQALSLPTLRHQHYRLVEISGVVHKFDPRKENQKG